MNLSPCLLAFLTTCPHEFPYHLSGLCVLCHLPTPRSRLYVQAKAGAAMNVIGLIMANLLINSLAIPMFDVFSYPSWADNSTCQA